MGKPHRSARETAAPLSPIEYTGNGRKLFVTQMGDARTFIDTQKGDVKTVETFPVAEAFRRTRAGDRLQFLTDTYRPNHVDEIVGCKTISRTRPFVLNGIQGKPDKPVIISGQGANCLIKGADAPDPTMGLGLPSPANFSFFHIKGCEWIDINHFTVSDCWPCFIMIEDSRFITVSNIKATGSQYLIFARGADCYHLLIEQNDWQQDPLGVLWSQINWNEVKETGGFYRYLNGGLFGSEDITGSVIFRRNRIADAFNGIRMKASGGDSRYNWNVEVYENEFLRVRDNAIEPERHALNWTIRHNRIQDVHGWFSFDRVLGGWWFVFGNRGSFTSRPGQPQDEHSGGKIYKFKNFKKQTERDRAIKMLPVHIFHNSYFSRSDLIKDGEIYQFRHRNNAIQFCLTPDDGEALCHKKRRYFGKKFLTRSPVNKWPAGVIFEGDLANIKFEPHKHNPLWHEKCRYNRTFKFKAPAAGDFGISRMNPDEDTQPVPILLDGIKKDWPGTDNWGRTPERVGALNADGTLIDGPPFVFHAPQKKDRQGKGGDGLPKNYRDLPRVVQVRREVVAPQSSQSGETKLQIVIAFSTPMVDADVTAAITLENNTQEPGDYVTGDLKLRELTFSFQRDWSACQLASAFVYLPRTLRNADKTPVTLWATVDDRIRWEGNVSSP